MLYRAIPSLTDYILIESESIHIEHFTINKEGFWQLKELNKPDEEIFLETLDVKLLLEEIYEAMWTKIVGDFVDLSIKLCLST